jgi:RNA polymerase sigma-70 factor (ECF subfamily)
MMPSASAFEALYDTHFDAVLRALAAYGIPAASLEDALQEVFLVAYRRASSFEGQASARAWLCAVARRVASRWHRASRRRERRLDAFAAMDRAAPDPERAYACQEAASRVAAVLSALDPKQRDAFVLSDVAGLTRIELAAALGVNPNTAWGRVRAARAALARDLGGVQSVEAVLDDVATSRTDLHRRVLGMIAVEIGTAGVASSAVSMATVGLVSAIAAIGIAVLGARAIAPIRSNPPENAPVERIAAAPSDAVPRPIAPPATPAAPPAVAPLPAHHVDPPRHASPRPAAPRAAAVEDRLALERAALSEARESLQRGAPARTLELLDAYGQRFPSGVMATEASRLRVLALCRSGDTAAARSIAGDAACTNGSTDAEQGS